MSWVVYMIKKIKYIIIILLVFLMAPNVNAKEQVNLYLFWGDGCPHCEAEQNYLEELEDEFRNLKITKYEVWYNSENNQFMKQIAAETNESLTGVPVTIIGQTIITGFSEPTKQQIRRAINYYSENKHEDMVKQIKEGNYEPSENISDEEFIKQEKKLNKKTTIKLPIIKELNLKNFELSTAVPILGILAGLSLPIIWLIITFGNIVNIQQNEKIKLKLLSLGLVIITASSILTSVLNIEYLNWIFKSVILLICVILIINKFQNLKLSNTMIKTLTILSATMIGWFTHVQYWQVLNELINTQKISMMMKILFNAYYCLSYLIPCILILLIYYAIWKKLSEKNRELVQVTVWLITILIIIFV